MIDKPQTQEQNLPRLRRSNASWYADLSLDCKGSETGNTLQEGFEI